MNGRVYDYNLGKFMSVDPFIVAPTNSQSFNPYSYIMNNPLAGTDPSGYESQDNIPDIAENKAEDISEEQFEELAIYENGEVVVTTDQGSYHIGTIKIKSGANNSQGQSIADTQGVGKPPTDAESGSMLSTAIDVGIFIAEFHPVVGGLSAAYHGIQSAVDTYNETGSIVEAATGGLASGVFAFITKKTKALELLTNKTIPSIKEQALELKALNNNKNSVRIQTQDKKIHYDLDGASHKGVETPHVQTSHLNTNPNTGQTFWNKDRSAAGVKPMTQQDVRTVRKYLQKKDDN